MENVCATFLFRNKETKELVKYFKSSVAMQSILNLFKRFEFQIGNHLENIEKDEEREIELLRLPHLRTGVAAMGQVIK